MNYDGPRQIQDGPSKGKWHYTSHNNSTGTHATGYCSGIRACPQCKGEGFISKCTHCGDRGFIEVAQCPGHDTEHEACVHQTEFLLAERLRLDGCYADQQFKCEECGAWTDRFASVDGWNAYPLCDEHRTTEVVTRLFGTVGTSVHS